MKTELDKTPNRKTSELIKERLLQSEKDLKEGKTTSHKEAKKKLAKWLK